jgi:tetratricopeptide (TPR) repeat protein
MSRLQWLEILGWGDREARDLRFIGYAYLKEGKYEVARKYFEALVVLNPTSFYDLSTLGSIHLQTGNNLMALNYIEQALKFEPLDSPTLLNRTKALLGLGYKKQALAQAKQLEQSSDPFIADQARSLGIAYS